MITVFTWIAAVLAIASADQSASAGSHSVVAQPFDFKVYC
jgi:hypothetical protein